MRFHDDVNSSPGPVTFLLTDIEGSTRLWQEDPEGMAKALARHDALIGAVVRAHGGRLIKSKGEGDATFSVFGVPSAAVAAAAATQQAIASEAWPVGHLRVRIALHTGEAEARTDDFFGPAVNRCARLRSIAHGGQTICSRTTAELVADHLPAHLTLLDLGTHRLRDLDRAEHVFEISTHGADEFPPLKSQDSLRYNLPPNATKLIGRRDEIHVVSALLETRRLVTLTGIGGVGKTRLAAAAAEVAADWFPDGVVWLELATLSDPDGVARVVADGLDIPAAAGAPVLSVLCSALGSRHQLVVLDNCEQVRGGVAELAASVMRECPGVVVLATSRQPLAVEGEQVVTVSPLGTNGPSSPSVELLADRIGETVLRAEVATGLEQIAAYLDGVPLALELAAARCRSLGTDEVAYRLGQSVAFLGDRSRPTGRHQTLEAALDWSYRLLEDGERRVLERLSVFAGPFSVAGAQAVAGVLETDTSAVTEAVASLVDKSLLTQAGGTFRMLETTRQFAARHLDVSGCRAVAEEAHARYVAGVARAVHAGLRGPEEGAWVDVLDDLWPDVRVAIGRGLDRDDVANVSEIIIHLAMAIFVRRPEGFPWINEAVRRWGDTEGPHRHELLAAASFVAFSSQEIERAVELAERAMALDPDPGTAVECLPQIAALGAYFFAGRVGEGKEIAETLAASDDLVVAARAVASQSLGYGALGDGDAARAAGVAAERLALATGNPSAIAYALAAHAGAVAGTDPALASSLAVRACAAAASVRNQWSARIAAGLAGTAGGDPGTALRTCVEAALDLQKQGWTTHAWYTAWYLPGVLWDLGRHEDAALALGSCERSLARPPGYRLPSPLREVLAGGGSAALQQQRAVGAKLDLVQLLRVIDVGDVGGP